MSVVGEVVAVGPVVGEVVAVGPVVGVVVAVGPVVGEVVAVGPVVGEVIAVGPVVGVVSVGVIMDVGNDTAPQSSEGHSSQPVLHRKMHSVKIR